MNEDEDVIDGTLLAHDPGLQLALLVNDEYEGIGPASQPTRCRFENKMGAGSCYRLAMWLVFAYINRKKQARQELHSYATIGGATVGKFFKGKGPWSGRGPVPFGNTH